MASDAPPLEPTPATATPNTTRTDHEAEAPAPAPAPAANPTAKPKPKPSTLGKMGFAPVETAAPTAADDIARAAATVAPPPSPATTPTITPAEGRQASERAKMLAPKHQSSSLGFIKAAKQRRKPWYRPTLVRLIRLAQLLITVRWTVAALQHYRDGSICPYPVICSTGFVEIGLLCVSKISALLMYPLLAMVFLSKCATIRTFFQHTYIAEIMNLYGLHELHVQFGYELAGLTALHAGAHVVRYALHDPRLLLCSPAKGGHVTLSGYVAAGLLVLVVLSLGWDWLKRRVGFEPRKAVHMLAAPMLLALCFHHPRLLATGAFLLVAYGLDWAYSNLFKTFRVDAPRLFPIGNGTLVEFRLPHGFQCRSGQYVFVCAPYISKYEWHAFSTIPITHIDGSVGCSFYAQACGDWTNALLAAAHRNVRRPLWVNGAYPSPFDTSVKFDYLFLVCTGIGITPGISVVSQYCHSKVIVLVWVCRSQELIDLYRSELQVVQSKVFHTGSGSSGSSNKGASQPSSRVEGSVVYASGRPDLCGEIKNVILHRRPLDPRLAAQAAAARVAPSALPSFATVLAANANAGEGTEAATTTTTPGSPKTPRSSLRRTMIPVPTPEHALEAGIGIAPASPGTGTVTVNVRRSLNGGAVGVGVGVAGQPQPVRQALTLLYEVDREEEVDPSEWLVLYCGASTSLGDTLKEYCAARGIKYKTEFFGSW